MTALLEQLKKHTSGNNCVVPRCVCSNMLTPLSLFSFQANLSSPIEVRTQTPWKLKKNKSVPETKTQNKRQGKPKKQADPLNYMQQKSV